MRSTRAIVALAILCLLPLACGDGSPASAPSRDRPVVYTTFYPTTFFVARLAGEFVNVVCPVPPDEDAIFWQPSPEVIAKYQQADLVVINGAEFEKWVLTASLPVARVVNTAKPFESEFVRFKTGVTHSHGPAGAHAHEGIDGHTWVDPVNAIVQVGQIEAALVKLLPEHAGEIAANAKGLVARLAALDAELKRLAESYDGSLILASHPAYNYLARRYGLNVTNLDLDPESMPTPEVWAAIAAAQQEHPARFLLWESEPAPEIRDRFEKELSIRSILFSPCELMAPEELEEGVDYFSVMNRNLSDLAPALGAESGD